VPFAIVHLNVAEAPIVNPVTPEVGDAGVVIVAAPAITVHVPDPVVGVFPARVAVVIPQRFWLAPAAAVAGSASTLITISSVELAHEPLLVVQRRVADAPTVKPVRPEVGDAGVVIVATPAITLHTPVPTAGVFPANVAVVRLQNV
jgi:hypothetical protein